MAGIMFSKCLLHVPIRNEVRRSLLGARRQSLALCSYSTKQQPKEQKSEPREKLFEKNAAINPLKHPDFFDVKSIFTTNDLYRARVHMGHKEGTLNPRMKPYLLGSRLGYLIFNLDETSRLLRDALNFAAHIAYRRGIILFINRTRQTSYIVEEAAKSCGEYAHCRPFNHGTFSDADMYFGATIRLPDLMIFISTLDTVFNEHQAVMDANRLLIPTIGIVDTSCDPTLLSYPVPGNDDSPASIEFYCRVFKEAIMRGKEKAKSHPPPISS